MITAQLCTNTMKKCKILPFQNDQFVKNSLFGPYFAHFLLFPADMVISLLKSVNTINFAPEKVVRTWSETQKASFFTKIWSLPQKYRNMVSQGINSKK